MGCLLAKRLFHQLEESFCLHQIIGGIDADGLLLGKGNANLITVFNPAQLLEALGLLERGKWQSGDGRQHVCSIGIQPDMLVKRLAFAFGFLQPILFLHAAQIRNHAAGEIHRFADNAISGRSHGRSNRGNS